MNVYVLFDRGELVKTVASKETADEWTTKGLHFNVSECEVLDFKEPILVTRMTDKAGNKFETYL